jgi:hypothetical protein
MTRWLAIAVVPILLAASARAARLPITIDGVFIDAATGHTIPHARVELRQRHWGFPLEPAETPLATTTTNTKGYFRFIGPWRGRFRLWCTSSSRRRMGTQEVRDAARDLRVLGYVYFSGQKT